MSPYHLELLLLLRCNLNLWDARTIDEIITKEAREEAENEEKQEIVTQNMKPTKL